MQHTAHQISAEWGLLGIGRFDADSLNQIFFETASGIQQPSELFHNQINFACFAPNVVYAGF